jgi:hypothetical protein
MSLLDKLFGKDRDSNSRNINMDKFGISIHGIDRKSSGEVIIDFNVPSKKMFFISIETDSFTNERTIKFKAVASLLMDKLMTWGDGGDFIQLNIGFRNLNGNDFITFSTYQKTLKFKKGDKIAFLFKDQIVIEFELLEQGYRIEKDNSGVIIESFASISFQDLEKFRTINTVKWRHIPGDTRKPVTGTLGLELQNDIIDMTRVYKFIFENPLD